MHLIIKIYYYRKDYQEALNYMRRANALVSAHPQMVFEQNFIKVNLGELYLLTNNLDSAQICLDESYRFFSEIQHNSAVYYLNWRYRKEIWRWLIK